MAGEYLYTHGPQDQEHFECSGCDPDRYLAAAGIRTFGFDKKDKCVEKEVWYTAGIILNINSRV